MSIPDPKNKRNEYTFPVDCNVVLSSYDWNDHFLKYHTFGNVWKPIKLKSEVQRQNKIPDRYRCLYRMYVHNHNNNTSLSPLYQNLSCCSLNALHTNNRFGTLIDVFLASILALTISSILLDSSSLLFGSQTIQIIPLR